MGLKDIFRIRKRENCIYIGDWYVGWHTWRPEIVYAECGYEDARANLTISLFGWLSRFYFPWKSKRFPDGDCDAPQYGIAIHGKALWVYKGGDGNWGGNKIWAWDLPFVSYGSAIRWDMYVGSKDKPQHLWTSEDWHEKDKTYTKEIGTEWEYEIQDPYDGEIIPCIVKVEELEWRPKWLKWLPLFAKIKRSISVEFKKEMGSRKGSWKGGVIGCDHPLKKNESIKDCLDRMLEERKF